VWEPLLSSAKGPGACGQSVAFVARRRLPALTNVSSAADGGVCAAQPLCL